MRWFVALVALFILNITCRTAGYGDESALPAFDPYHAPGIYWAGLTPYLKAGNGSIEGRLTAKTEVFGLIAFPNEKVDLLPATHLSYWILRSTGYNLEHDDYKKRDPLPHFPNQLAPYLKSTTTDNNGYFRFDNLPDGQYYVYANPLHREFRNPTRYTTEEQTAANGDTVTTLQKTQGVKELGDTLVIAAMGTVDAKDSRPSTTILGFDVLGEATCCKAEL